MVDLKAKPFWLNDEEIRWVEDTIASMTADEKPGQLFVLLKPVPGANEEQIRALMESARPGGMRWQVSAATQHVRACEPGAVQPWQDCYRDLAALLPQAEGTRYAYQRKKRGLFW